MSSSFVVPPNNKVAGVTTGMTSDLDNLYNAIAVVTSTNVLNSVYGSVDSATGARWASNTTGTSTSLGALTVSGGNNNRITTSYWVGLS
jgi:hypothetical protein